MPASVQTDPGGPVRKAEGPGLLQQSCASAKTYWEMLTGDRLRPYIRQGDGASMAIWCRRRTQPECWHTCVRLALQLAQSHGKKLPWKGLLEVPTPPWAWSSVCPVVRSGCLGAVPSQVLNVSKERDHSCWMRCSQGMLRAWRLGLDRVCRLRLPVWLPIGELLRRGGRGVCASTPW